MKGSAAYHHPLGKILEVEVGEKRKESSIQKIHNFQRMSVTCFRAHSLWNIQRKKPAILCQIISKLHLEFLLLFKIMFFGKPQVATA